MGFGQAIQTCLRKRAGFEGRASRSEFWWCIPFVSHIAMGLNAVNLITAIGVIYIGGALAGMWRVAMSLPTLAVAIRRLRDAGRSWMERFWLLIPIAGGIIVASRLAEPSQVGEPAQTPASPPTA
jgi:uncharacterized membrane protein YhaH (DUF805 family)